MRCTRAALPAADVVDAATMRLSRLGLAVTRGKSRVWLGIRGQVRYSKMRFLDVSQGANPLLQGFDSSQFQQPTQDTSFPGVSCEDPEAFQEKR